MKLDSHYSHIWICPTTKEPIHPHKRFNREGVCHICGHDNGDCPTHATKKVGRYNRPSWFEKLFQGKKTQILYKTNEDKAWNPLKKS